MRASGLRAQVTCSRAFSRASRRAARSRCRPRRGRCSRMAARATRWQRALVPFGYLARELLPEIPRQLAKI